MLSADTYVTSIGESVINAQALLQIMHFENENEKESGKVMTMLHKHESKNVWTPVIECSFSKF